MLKIMSLFLLSFLVCGIAYALDAAPETIEQAVALIPNFLEKLLAGDYISAGGALVMVGGVALRQYGLPKWNISADLLPWVIGVISVLGVTGLAMFNGAKGGDIGDAALNGAYMAIFAGGLWSLLGKKVAKLLLGDKYQEPQS